MKTASIVLALATLTVLLAACGGGEPDEGVPVVNKPLQVAP